MTPFRAILVAAVSTSRQAAEDSKSIESQLDACRAACERAGWPIVAQITIPGHSRDYKFLHELIADCPEYADLVAKIEAGIGNLVVCAAYDRLWRNDWIRADFTRLCTIHRCQIYSVAQPRMPQPPEELSHRMGFQQIMEVLSGPLSEAEQRVRIARMRSGMRARIERGLHGTNPIPPYGYQHCGPDEPMAICEEEARWVRWIYRERLRGASYINIAKALTELGIPPPGAMRDALPSSDWWRNTTVKKILHNDWYIGTVRWGEYENPHGLHEPLVSETDFATVQRLNRIRSRHRRERKYTGDWLNGLLRCGLCGHSMSYQHQTQGERSYLHIRCSYYLIGGDCESNSHMAHYIHDAVWTEIVAMLSDPDAWRDARQSSANVAALQDELTALQAEIDDNRRRYERTLTAYQAGAVSLDELTTQRARLNSELAALRERATELEASLSSTTTARAHYDEAARLAQNELTTAQKRHLARLLIRQVEVGKERIVIRWL